MEATYFLVLHVTRAVSHYRVGFVNSKVNVQNALVLPFGGVAVRPDSEFGKLKVVVVFLESDCVLLHLDFSFFDELWLGFFMHQPSRKSVFWCAVIMFLRSSS